MEGFVESNNNELATLEICSQDICIINKNYDGLYRPQSVEKKMKKYLINKNIN